MTDGLAPAALQRLLGAVTGVAAGLSLPTTLRHIIDAATALAGARYGALGVIGDDQTLTEFVTTGLDEDAVRAIGPRPQGHGVLGLLIADPRPLRLRDLRAHPLAYGFPPNHPTMRSFLGVPIRVGNEVFGNLYLCEKIGADEFTAEDELLVESLAAIAAVAIENSRLHERLQDLAVLHDRERIARDLHDKVIQRLFAAGMSLQATIRLPAAEIAARAEQVVDELDSIVNDIRATIFDLELRPADRPTLSAAALALVDEMTRPARIEASVHLRADLELGVAPEVAEDVLSALREALANVARHSDARHVEVTLGRDADMLVLEVADDGRGFDVATTAKSTGGRGLKNLAARAADRGGTCDIVSGDASGTVLRWRVPLGSDASSPPA